jgi:uncharacterized protein YbjQ (UPF0145 family)
MSEFLQSLSLAVQFGIPLLVLIVAYFIGNLIEKKHFKDIQERETKNVGFPVVSFETIPEDWRVSNSYLVSGSVVISLDYFKRVIAGLRGLMGGRIKTYEPLLERARREALLRMVESAKSGGYNAIINVRLETSRLANARGNGKGIAGIEMLAFGTAINYQNHPNGN